MIEIVLQIKEKDSLLRTSISGLGSVQEYCSECNKQISLSEGQGQGGVGFEGGSGENPIRELRYLLLVGLSVRDLQ
jgi:hypothetical protein